MHEIDSQLTLTAAELDLVEAALHTQEKMLTVQSKAGHRAARERLNATKLLLRRIRRANPEPMAPAPSRLRTLAQMLRFGMSRA